MYQSDNSGRIDARELQLLETVRRLWMEHVFWTRLFIISTAANLPDIRPVTDRLLRNPKDFAARFVPFTETAWRRRLTTC